MTLCHSCGLPFEGYAELALHISSQKRGHRKGKTWAAAYLLKVRQLNQRKDFETRVPLSAEDKENRRDTVREISGQEEIVTTVCPHCKGKTRQRLPVEYTRSKTAWHIGQFHAVMCPLCGR